jgi:hypothetical protein
MSISKLHTIGILVLSSLIGSAAVAPVATPGARFERQACDSSDCLLRPLRLAGDDLDGEEEALAPAELQNVNEFLDRPLHPVDLSQYPQFSVVGEIEHTELLPNGKIKHYWGSSVIVSPCYILTAHHVVFGDDIVPLKDKDYVARFRIGQGPEEFGFAGQTWARPVLRGAYNIAGQNDWVLMRLDKCAGSLPRLGWVEPTRYSSEELVRRKQEIAVVGYTYRDHSENRAQLRYSVGIIESIDKRTGLLSYNASLLEKQSGGVGFTMEDGVMKIAILTTGGFHDPKTPNLDTYRTWTALHTNVGENAYDILNRPSVKAILAPDKARYHFINPAEQQLNRPLPSAEGSPQG